LVNEIYFVTRMFFAVVTTHITIIWVVAPCGPEDGYWRFGGTSYPHLHSMRFDPEEGGSTVLQNVGIHV
jgi:hypothetical protein